MISLVLKTPAATEPVHVLECMELLRVDESEQVRVESLIPVARAMVEDYTGRTCINTVFTLSGSDWGELFPGGVCKLPRTPLVSVAHLKYLAPSGEVTIATGDLEVATGVVPPVLFAPENYSTLELTDAKRHGRVVVEFTAGYGTKSENVDPILAHAVRTLVVHLFENPTPFITGTIVNEMPMTLRHMLRALRVESED